MKQLASSNVAQPADRPEKKHRRRRRFLLAVVLLLAGTVWLTPYLLSTGPGCDLIVSIVNGRIKGTVRIGEISLSWLGPCRIGSDQRGVGGPVVDYARLLAGARVDIPMVGSRLEPRLDFSKVDIRPLIDRAIQALLAEQAGKMLEGILKDRLQKDRDHQDKDKTEDTDPLLDSLLDLLKKSQPRRDSDSKSEKP